MTSIALLNKDRRIGEADLWNQSSLPEGQDYSGELVGIALALAQHRNGS